MANADLSQCTLDVRETLELESSITEKSLKRLPSEALQSQISPKKARISGVDASESQVIVVEEGSPKNTSLTERPTSNDPQYSRSREDTQVGELAEDGLTAEQQLQELKIRAREKARERNAIISDLREQLNAMESDRDKWLNEATINETAEKCFRDNIRKFQENVRRNFITAIKADHKSKIEELKRSHEDVLEAKEESFSRKLDSKDKKCAEQLQVKDNKINELEATLREVKSSAKQAERDLKTQHRSELRKYKPEHSSAVKDQKSELKMKDAALDKMTHERDELLKEDLEHKAELSKVHDQNRKLNEIVRNNSKKVIELQEEATVWKKNATEFHHARNTLRTDFEAHLQSRDQLWEEKLNAATQKHQEKDILFTQSQRGISLLNQANDRQILQIRELEKRLAAAEAKVLKAQEVIRALEATKHRFVSNDESSGKAKDGSQGSAPHTEDGSGERIESDMAYLQQHDADLGSVHLD